MSNILRAPRADKGQLRTPFKASLRGRVLIAVRQSEVLSRSTVAVQTGIPRNSASPILSGLVRDGLLRSYTSNWNNETLFKLTKLGEKTVASFIDAA